MSRSLHWGLSLVLRAPDAAPRLRSTASPTRCCRAPGFPRSGSESVGAWRRNYQESERTVKHALIPSLQPLSDRTLATDASLEFLSGRNESTRLGGKRRQRRLCAWFPRQMSPARPRHSSVLSSQGLEKAGFLLTSKATELLRGAAVAFLHRRWCS